MLGIFAMGLNANGVSSPKTNPEDDTFSCRASEQVEVTKDCDGDGEDDYSFLVCPEYQQGMEEQLEASCG